MKKKKYFFWKFFCVFLCCVVSCPLQDTCVESCHIDMTQHIWTVYKQLNIFLKPKNCVIQGLAVLPYLINYLLLDTWQPYLIPLWHHFCISFHLCAKCNSIYREEIVSKKFIFWFHYDGGEIDWSWSPQRLNVFSIL